MFNFIFCLILFVMIGMSYPSKIYGISMLIEQAKPCFKIWFGKNPSVDAKMLKAIYKKI